MGLRCKRCGSEVHVKNGLMRTKQRYLCKACGLNFTDTPARGKPLALKAAAVLLYVSGLSMNRTAQLLGVSTPTIQAWLEQFAQAYAQKPEPEGRAVVIELDEMWHYLNGTSCCLNGTSYCGRSQVIEIARTRVTGRRNCRHVNLDFALRRVLVCARLCVHVHPGHPQPRLAARHPAARVLPGGRKGQETHPPQPDPLAARPPRGLQGPPQGRHRRPGTGLPGGLHHSP